ncbi:DUF2000 domain-containing protein [Candidatus Gracilibacteria bacterium]|nr:DUF2000 domain-containing protein [Candidatus Gracilibacteria bacterium]
MRFDTKIAVVLRTDVAVWQRLNMVAFLVSGIAARTEDIIGADYEDGSGRRYLPMFRQPVLVFGSDNAGIRSAYERAVARELALSIFTDELFATSHDEANRAAVAAVPSATLALAGIALYGERKKVDAVVKGLSLHA